MLLFRAIKQKLFTSQRDISASTHFADQSECVLYNHYSHTAGEFVYSRHSLQCHMSELSGWLNPNSKLFKLLTSPTQIHTSS